MTVWCHLPTIFKQRHVLRIAALLTLCVALTTTLFFGDISHATTGINQTLSFQGRLLSSTGGVVPDGYYNIQFKIYQDGDGTTAGDTGGSLKWTESYVNNGSNNGVEVKNGYFSVNLGSLNPFGTSVDWNQDTLWLSMNIGGSATSCSSFGTSPCAADGEMLPMKRITSVPYALQAESANKLGGLTAGNFVQLGQGVQEDASSNTSSIFVNKTGSGNLLQLQNTATDILTVNNTGDLTLGSNTDKAISVATAADDTAGSSLRVKAGAGGDGSGANGGDLVLQGGNAGGTNGDGGVVVINSGNGSGSGGSGTIYIGSSNDAGIQIGNTNLAGGTQTIVIGANTNSGGSSNVVIGADGSSGGGSTAIQSKDDTTVSTNGTQRARFSSSSDTLYVGNADTSGNAPTANGFTIQGTSSTSSNVQGGSLTLQSGSATSGDANGGTLALNGGSGSGSGATGLVVINTPTFQMASEQDCSSDCSIAQSSIDGNGGITVKATAPNLTVTMNDPTITTAGRIIYVTATDSSSDFKLSINGGGSYVTLHPDSTATMVWNGYDWTVAGNSNATTLQDVYNNTVQTTGSANLVMGSGLTIHDDSSSPVNGTLLQVQNSTGGSLFSVNSVSSGPSNIQIGDGSGTTLFTLDRASSAPSVSDSSLIGSMYFDTTLGELQCYEASGWGACTASPDSFVTLSPEYSNAVMHGSGNGTMSSDMCSDSLNINDGTSSQPTICGTHETYNFYKWTSSQVSTQEKDIYVTYQLPSTFKEFVSGSTSLMGRTDSSDSAITYQVYRNNGTSGLTACGSATSVSTGSQSSWQKATATSTADPSSCSFAAGDSIVFKISMSADNNANAYVSNLGFTFSNH